MKNWLLIALLALVGACSQITPGGARDIAFKRLSGLGDGPSLHEETLYAALEVTQHAGGKYLVEVRDESRNLLWAVIVHASGESEVSRMAIDG